MKHIFSKMVVAKVANFASGVDIAGDKILVY